MSNGREKLDEALEAVRADATPDAAAAFLMALGDALVFGTGALVVDEKGARHVQVLKGPEQGTA